ncbi:MAG: hypothetical protein WA888_14165 [Burkholderiaceae bacterium]
MSVKSLHQHEPMVRFYQQATVGALVSLLCLPTSGFGQNKPTPDTASAEQFRIAASYPSSTPVLGKAQQRLLDLINNAGGGSILATLIPPGEVVPVEKVLNAVANGSLEAAFTDPATWVDKDPAFALFSGMPLSPDVLHGIAWVERGEGSRLMKELYARYNVEAQLCGAFMVPAGLWLRKPIEKTADLIDLKVSADGLGAAVMAGVGARVSQLPRASLASALKDGSIDAVRVESLSLAEQYAFVGDQAPYYYPQGWGQQTGIRVLIVSRQFWASMSDAHRTIVRSACNSLTVEELARSQAARSEAVSFLKEKQVNSYRFSPETTAAIEKSWRGVTEKLSESNEWFATGWQSWSRFSAGSRAFESLIR